MIAKRRHRALVGKSRRLGELPAGAGSASRAEVTFPLGTPVPRWLGPRSACPPRRPRRKRASGSDAVLVESRGRRTTAGVRASDRPFSRDGHRLRHVAEREVRPDVGDREPNGSSAKCHVHPRTRADGVRGAGVDRVQRGVVVGTSSSIKPQRTDGFRAWLAPPRLLLPRPRPPPCQTLATGTTSVSGGSQTGSSRMAARHPSVTTRALRGRCRLAQGRF